MDDETKNDMPAHLQDESQKPAAKHMKQLHPLLIVSVAAVAAYFIFTGTGKQLFHLSPQGSTPKDAANVSEALAAKFEYLSQNGNSSCSASFRQSIASGTTGSERLQGSCCSAMDPHRYAEQVDGLKKYADIPEIPPDPYDIDAKLAQELAAYYDVELTPGQQQAYDYAMQNSNEKGPCCCKCWRWYVYGGLAKLLIQNYGFTGEQLTEVWNLSDGCGGPGDHATHP
ncbi:MAG: hypothetical protein A2806_00105 [Candidatus Terrybacteria bacterium RIFCSPHIGHO2_01_FULL_48_17]|uniref:Uncharacterized protein n=1 Tax=Candidatus Terrybacteria bacterium RIFCSPHIGHO2_01_FULL_48_17 TaxID=1802362 RepID=A0A1G2PJU0_9BACT|nr:MAG: hypothetical protein A2806_00105 [Candidatus Terrybacteria bacterium RIFCSPHIGHO2_01_FULL_48_17]OHA53003.1 MAG: hypothetical protein A3A30_01735 [Candidatus Terrybacteria bacterium RIFCSPLOWO2_01_FULL_48_14]